MPHWLTFFCYKQSCSVAVRIPPWHKSNLGYGRSGRLSVGLLFQQQKKTVLYPSAFITWQNWYCVGSNNGKKRKKGSI